MPDLIFLKYLGLAVKKAYMPVKTLGHKKGKWMVVGYTEASAVPKPVLCI